jgi:Uma2 family endonuclease
MSHTLELPRLRWCVSDYERIIEAGLLSDTDRVELLDGEILRMAQIGDPHAFCVDFLAAWFVRHAGDRAWVSSQQPLQLSDADLPQPDVVLLAGPGERYRNARRTAGDALLVIEVADSTLAFDTRVKAPRYARFGVVELWVIDLPGRRVLQFDRPGARGYARTRTVEPPARVAPAALPDLALPLDALFG